MSDDEAVWDSSFLESVFSVRSELDVSFSNIIGTGENREIFAQPRPVGFQCERCKKVLKTKRGLQSHLKRHKLRDAAGQVVNTEGLLASSSSVAESVLRALRSVNGPPGQTIQDYCVYSLLMHDSLEWEELVRVVSESIVLNCMPQKFISLSALRVDFLTKLQHLLADVAFRTMLADQFAALGLDTEPDTVCLFLGMFVRHFAEELFLVLIRSMRSSRAHSLSVPLQQLTLKQKQMYHYVVGSVVKSVLRQGFRLKKENPKWTRVLNCIRTCFQLSGSNDSPESDVQKWTKLVDKGGLTYVGQQAPEFFLLCGTIAMGVKPPSRYNFFKQLYECPATICLWEEVVQDLLIADESTWLMEYMCRLFYNTYCVGCCNLARNDHLSKSQACVSTRQRLAR